MFFKSGCLTVINMWIQVLILLMLEAWYSTFLMMLKLLIWTINHRWEFVHSREKIDGFFLVDLRWLTWFLDIIFLTSFPFTFQYTWF